MSIVTIIGAGMMGTAMCWPLADNGHQVRLVGTPLDEEIIRSIRETRIHPKLEREVPAGVQACFVDELPQACAGRGVDCRRHQQFWGGLVRAHRWAALPPGSARAFDHQRHGRPAGRQP